MLVCYKCLVGGRRLVSPAARRDLLSSPNYPCKSREKRRADERTRTAFLLQLRVNCSYWTILCFTLLDNRRYQRERRCVMRCNERLAVGILRLERLREGAGYVGAADLTAPAQRLLRLDPARLLLVGQAAGPDDGVIEPALLQPLVGAGLGAQVRPHRLGAAFRVAGAHRTEHQVAACVMLLRRLDELYGATVVHRLLAGCPAAGPGPGGEDHGVAAVHRPTDRPDSLFFEVNQQGVRAIGLDVGHLLLLANKPPHLVSVLHQHPDQTPRRLAVRPRYENLHTNHSFASTLEPLRSSVYPWAGGPTRIVRVW